MLTAKLWEIRPDGTRSSEPLVVRSGEDEDSVIASMGAAIRRMRLPERGALTVQLEMSASAFLNNVVDADMVSVSEDLS